MSDSVVQLYIPGIRCGSCVAGIEKTLKNVPGIQTMSVNLATKTATLGIDPRFHLSDALSALAILGKPAEYIENEEQQHQKQIKETRSKYQRHLINMVVAFLLAAPLMVWELTSTTNYLNTPIGGILWKLVGILSLGVLVIAGKQFFIGMARALRHGRATMDTLVSLSTSMAWLYSMLVVLKPSLFPANAQHLYFEASVMIIGLINLGQALELRAKGKASQAIHHLTDKQAKTAIKVIDGKEVKTKTSALMVKDILRVKPGDIIPADGRITEGNTTIDESMLTGEATAVHKEIKDEVFAGTLNHTGTFLMQVESVGRDTRLGYIIKSVKEAQASKMPIAQIADKVSGVFVPIVIGLAILTALTWYFFGPLPVITYMLMSAIAVLIIACPCALGLATPVAVMQSMSKAAEYGILVKNGDALQTASQIDTLVLDKTGTLTEGKPRITHHVTTPSLSEEEFLQLAASLEAYSEHPLAHAILTQAQAKQVYNLTVTDFKVLPGLGVQGKINGTSYLLGSAELMKQHRITTDELNRQCPNIYLNQSTLVYLAKVNATHNICLGMFTVNDPLRAEATQAIKHLTSAGINVVMLTGDNAKAAEHMAQQAGISSFKAQQQPQDKAAFIKKLQTQGKKVGMCGDGINDAPALAQADVSFALTEGTDTALETASIALTHNSLQGLPDTIQLSKATLKTIKQNLFGAFAYNVISIPIAAGILYPFTGLLLNPMIASAAMALSSITVVMNANRLRTLKLNRTRPAKPGKTHALKLSHI